MLRKQLVLFILLMAFVSCTKNEYSTRFDQIILQKSKELEKEEDLTILAHSKETLDSTKQWVSVFFFTLKKTDINEARRICVKCIEEIRDSINSDITLQPYLKPYPIPISEMQICIMFAKDLNTLQGFGPVYRGFGGVSTVLQKNNTLFYYSFSKETQMTEDYYVEPYERALAIVRGEYPETDEEAVREANKKY